MSTELAESQLQHWCPGLKLRHGWGRYTADGTIPWKLFWLFYRQLPRVAAGVRLNQIEALSTSIGMAFIDRKKNPAAWAAAKGDIEMLQRFAQGED